MESVENSQNQGIEENLRTQSKGGKGKNGGLAKKA